MWVQGTYVCGDGCHGVCSNGINGGVHAATDHVILAVGFGAQGARERFWVPGSVALDHFRPVVYPVVYEPCNARPLRVGEACAVVPEACIKEREMGPFERGRVGAGCAIGRVCECMTNALLE